VTQRVLAGAFEDQERFEQLLKKHDSYQKIYNYIYTISGNREVANDIAQEAIVEAWRNFAALKDTQQFHQWVSRIARNAYKDYHEKETNRTRNDFYEKILLFQKVTKRDGDPVKRLLTLFSQDTLQHAFRAIPVKQSVAILLYAVDGMSYQEIAELRSCSIGTVKSRIFNGRRLLSEVYSKLMRGESSAEFPQAASAAKNQAVRNSTNRAPVP